MRQASSVAVTTLMAAGVPTSLENNVSGDLTAFVVAGLIALASAYGTRQHLACENHHQQQTLST